MALRPIFSDSLPLSTFTDNLSYFQISLSIYYYSLKQEILDINLQIFYNFI